MSLAMLLLVVACDTADPDDSGALDTALQPLERCDNAWDDDQDGLVDEVGCATDWIVGAETNDDLGRHFATPGANAPWSYLRAIGTLVLDGEELVRAWETFPAAQSAPTNGFGFAVADGSVWTAYTTRVDREYFLYVDDHGPLGITAEGSVALGEVAHDVVSMTPAPDAGVFLLFGTQDDTVARVRTDPADPDLADPEVEYHSTLRNWAAAVSLVPDAAGDGAPGALVNCYGAGTSDLYFFDASHTGVVSDADADGHLRADLDWGLEPEPTADLDGDGYTELVLHAGTTDYLAFGPFTGELNEDDMVGLVGTGMSVQASLDGDDHLDVLMAGGGTGNIYLAHGPIDRAVTSVRDADSDILLDGLPEPSAVVAADLDQSGATWLVVGFGDAGGDLWGAPDDAGAIAAFPAPAGVALP